MIFLGALMGIVPVLEDLDAGRTTEEFEKPEQIKMRCSCPDYAGMCKHVSATMYGVGNRLDSAPELLFALRAVDHQELIDQAIPAVPLRAGSGVPTIEADDLGAIFDIDFDDSPNTAAETKTKKKPAKKKAAKPTKKAEKPTKKAVKSAKKVAKAPEKAGKPAKTAGSLTKRAGTPAKKTKQTAVKAKKASTTSPKTGVRAKKR
jgi:uncharacterized Zn finger protein